MNKLIQTQTRSLRNALPAVGGAVGGAAASGVATALLNRVPFMEPGGLVGDYVAPVVGTLVGGGVAGAVADHAYKPASRGVWVGAGLFLVTRLLAKALGVSLPGFGIIVAEQGTGAIVVDGYGLESASGASQAYVNSGGFGAAVTVNQGGFGAAFANPFAPRGVL